MVKAVITDHGGVLSSRQETPGALERWRAQLGLDEDSFRLALFDPDLGRRIALGTMAPSEGSKLIAQKLGIDVATLQVLRKECWSAPLINREFVEFLVSLKPLHRVACLTNWGLDARETLKERGLNGAFDLIVISAEEGLAKPDARIFEITLERLGVAAKEAIFVDDSEEYVEAASRLGLHALRFQGTQRTIREVRKFLGVPA